MHTIAGEGGVPTAQQICYLPLITVILRYVAIKKGSSQFCDRNVLKNTILKKAGNAPTVFCNERLRECTCVHDQRREAAKARDVPRDEAKKSSGNFIISGTPKNLLVLVTHRLKLLLALVLGDLLATLFLEVAHF